eukprot:gene6297-2929_t
MQDHQTDTESLGGNAKTTLLVCVANAPEHAEESLQSLQLGAGHACEDEASGSMTCGLYRSLHSELLGQMDVHHDAGVPPEAALAALQKEQSHFEAILSALREESTQEQAQTQAVLMARMTELERYQHKVAELEATIQKMEVEQPASTQSHQEEITAMAGLVEQTTSTQSHQEEITAMAGHVQQLTTLHSKMGTAHRLVVDALRQESDSFRQQALHENTQLQRQNAELLVTNVQLQRQLEQSLQEQELLSGALSKLQLALELAVTVPVATPNTSPGTSHTPRNTHTPRATHASPGSGSSPVSGAYYTPGVGDWAPDGTPTKSATRNSHFTSHTGTPERTTTTSAYPRLHSTSHTGAPEGTPTTSANPLSHFTSQSEVYSSPSGVYKPLNKAEQSCFEPQEGTAPRPTSQSTTNPTTPHPSQSTTHPATHAPSSPHSHHSPVFTAHPLSDHSCHTTAVLGTKSVTSQEARHPSDSTDLDLRLPLEAAALMGSNKGGHQADTPAGNTGTPASNTGIPAGNTGTPAGNTCIPAGNTGIPAGYTGTPAGNTGTPAGNTGTQAGNTGTQAGNTGTPAGNTGTQAGNTGTQAGNTGTQASKQACDQTGKGADGKEAHDKGPDQLSLERRVALALATPVSDSPPTSPAGPPPDKRSHSTRSGEGELSTGSAPQGGGGTDGDVQGLSPPLGAVQLGSPLSRVMTRLQQLDVSETGPAGANTGSDPCDSSAHSALQSGMSCEVRQGMFITQPSFSDEDLGKAPPVLDGGDVHCAFGGALGVSIPQSGRRGGSWGDLDAGMIGGSNGGAVGFESVADRGESSEEAALGGEAAGANGDVGRNRGSCGGAGVVGSAAADGESSEVAAHSGEAAGATGMTVSSDGGAAQRSLALATTSRKVVVDALALAMLAVLMALALTADRLALAMLALMLALVLTADRLALAMMAFMLALATPAHMPALAMMAVVLALAMTAHMLALVTNPPRLALAMAHILGKEQMTKSPSDLPVHHLNPAFDSCRDSLNPTIATLAGPGISTASLSPLPSPSRLPGGQAGTSHQSFGARLSEMLTQIEHMCTTATGLRGSLVQAQANSERQAKDLHRLSEEASEKQEMRSNEEDAAQFLLMPLVVSEKCAVCEELSKDLIRLHSVNTSLEEELAVVGVARTLLEQRAQRLWDQQLAMMLRRNEWWRLYHAASIIQRTYRAWRAHVDIRDLKLTVQTLSELETKNHERETAERSAVAQRVAKREAVQLGASMVASSMPLIREGVEGILVAFMGRQKELKHRRAMSERLTSSAPILDQSRKQVLSSIDLRRVTTFRAPFRLTQQASSPATPAPSSPPGKP